MVFVEAFPRAVHGTPTCRRPTTHRVTCRTEKTPRSSWGAGKSLYCSGGWNRLWGIWSIITDKIRHYFGRLPGRCEPLGLPHTTLQRPYGEDTTLPLPAVFLMAAQIRREAEGFPEGLRQADIVLRSPSSKGRVEPHAFSRRAPRMSKDLI